jgi:hypothetical protein
MQAEVPAPHSPEAVASSLPLLDSVRQRTSLLCAEMNLVRRVSYSSTRTCAPAGRLKARLQCEARLTMGLGIFLITASFLQHPAPGTQPHKVAEESLPGWYLHRRDPLAHGHPSQPEADAIFHHTSLPSTHPRGNAPPTQPGPAPAPAHLPYVQAWAGQHCLVCRGRQCQQAARVAQRLYGVQQPQVGKVVHQHL